MGLETFWTDYAAELQRKVLADWGTGAGYDWNGFPADPDAHLGAPGPRINREDIPARVASCVLKIRAENRKRPLSFQSNPAFKIAAKRHGFTSSSKLREALLALEGGA